MLQLCVCVQQHCLMCICNVFAANAAQSASWRRLYAKFELKIKKHDCMQAHAVRFVCKPVLNVSGNLCSDECQVPAIRAACADACMQQHLSALAPACRSMLATDSRPATCMLPDSLPDTHMHSAGNPLRLDGSHMPADY